MQNFVARITLVDGNVINAPLIWPYISEHETHLYCEFAGRSFSISYERVAKIENITPIYHTSFHELEVTDADGETRWQRVENNDYPTLRKFPLMGQDGPPILQGWWRHTIMGVTYAMVQVSYTIRDNPDDPREYHYLQTWLDKPGYVKVMAEWAKAHANQNWTENVTSKPS